MVAAWVAVAVLVAASVAVGPSLWLEVDEAATPPVSAARLPGGVHVVGQERQCGSGGCWWQLTLVPSDPAQTQTVAHPGERCAARGWIDRRTVCTGVQVHGDVVTAYVRYQRLGEGGSSG